MIMKGQIPAGISEKGTALHGPFLARRFAVEVKFGCGKQRIACDREIGFSFTLKRRGDSQSRRNPSQTSNRMFSCRRTHRIDHSG